MQGRVNEKPDIETSDPKAEQLAAMVEEIRARVRAQHPTGPVAGGIALPDLMPLLHARDAAEAKVAAIGTVNPRPPGLINSTAQFFKKLIGRALDWHVREQVEFNRAAISAIQATLDLFDENKTALAALAARIDAVAGNLANDDQLIRDSLHPIREQLASIRQNMAGVTQEFGDTRSHWNQWRQAWEQKLSANEIHFLRSVSELQGAFQHRVTLLEQEYRETAKLQHANFEAALVRAGEDIHKRFWADLDRIRTEYETIIHSELRLMRQKSALLRPNGEPAKTSTAGNGDFARLDWLKFAEKFRGREEYIKERQRMYADRYKGSEGVLDIGCGRGEMLEILRDAGIAARGIDLSDESVAMCRGKGLDAEKADLFEYLDAQPQTSLGGIVCSQVVEHLRPERLPELVRLAHEKLRRDGLLAIETPNPECLAIFATHFYLDPTHTRPVPPQLMAFYLEEAGFGRIETERLYPAVETMPSLASLPEDFRRDFFGSLDYAIFARRLGE